MHRYVFMNTYDHEASKVNQETRGGHHTPAGRDIVKVTADYAEHLSTCSIVTVIPYLDEIVQHDISFNMKHQPSPSSSPA